MWVLFGRDAIEFRFTVSMGILMVEKKRILPWTQSDLTGEEDSPGQ